MNDIDFLNAINSSLLDLENNLFKEKNEDYPNIFILGLPRSGTTLLAQVLFNNLDIKCTNNLMSKFWETPLIGLKLSELILKNKYSDYKSTYGKAKNISDPHEFSWFWHKHLKIYDIEAYNPALASEEIDWIFFKNVLVNFNHISKKIFIHKPLELIGYHLECFYKLFEKGIFIYIDRPLNEIACSLVDARLNYYGNINTWWGSYPPIEIYKKVKNKNFDKQISAQVFYLKKMYQEKFKLIDKKRLINVTYSDLCKNPQLIIDKVKKLSQNLDCEILQTDKPPLFSPSKTIYKRGDIYSKIVTELCKLQDEK